MRYFFILIFALFWACSPTDKPQNLLTKTQMAEIIADLAIYDNANWVNPNANLEISNRFVLEKHKTTPTIFRESYAYYIYNPDNLDEIYNEAKQIILNKDPDLEKKLNKDKQKNNTTLQN